ncbi:MAG: 2-amino-4-hydroxy-6-hydroxymethyldihydropteridine diphosphokinase [Planctomycetota bacterium]
MSREHTAYIGLGSNLGQRAKNLAGALESIDDQPRIRLIKKSTFIETEPVGGPPQGSYLNAAAEIRTTLEPAELLRTLQTIENAFGRERPIRWGPRTLDLDLLLYGQRVIKTHDLQVPHPRMHRRRFVLGPLREIAPHAFHPELNQSVEELFQSLTSPDHSPEEM